MRLGKKIKFNMIIAILLCMAFVVNIGATWAFTGYTFKAKSAIALGNNKTETYTEFASASGASGNYEYSIGNVNNQLSINYGFSHAHDLKVSFTATYTNTENSHLANDFSLNFVNRDKWCIDTAEMVGASGTVDGAEVGGDTYYSLASTSKTYSGTMYYMDTLTGSGTLPVISGVTFYTSPNNSYTYIGDNLTVTITPYYVKADVSKYNANHTFKATASASSAFTNWATYMNAIKNTVALNTSVGMIYNAYVNDDTALAYPCDHDWMQNNFSIVGQNDESLLYANTAYRYAINTDGHTTSRTYSAITAGNKYYGGLGIYVIPQLNKQTIEGVDTLQSGLVTVGITVAYHWQKDGNIDGSIATNMVEETYSNEIVELESTTAQGLTYNSYYYDTSISGPTYIDVFESIKLTAESPYTDVLKGGYSLVISGVSLSFKTSAPSGWISEATNLSNTYKVNNASQHSPVLVRIKDVATGERKYETDVSITNNGTSPIAISSFTVKAGLWYGDYGDNNSSFNAKIVDYLNEEATSNQANPTPPVKGDLANNTLMYDKTIWDVTFEDDVFTFECEQDMVYIPVGYTMTLISGVTIPLLNNYDPITNYYHYPKVEDFTSVTTNGVTTYTPIAVNDLWCSLDVNVNANTNVTYSAGSYTGAEVVVDGYYSTIKAGNSSHIYLRNNTKQNITQVNLAGLRLATFDTTLNSNLLPRDRLNTSSSVKYTLVDEVAGTTQTALEGSVGTSATQTTIIRPNEMILLYTITPNVDCVVYNYNITVTLEDGEDGKIIDLVMNDKSSKGDIVNNSETYYEFRIKSNTDLADYTDVDNPTSTYFTNPNDFAEQVIGGVYYYYYKGVICPHQSITAFKAVANNVEVEYLEHEDGVDENHYKNGIYTTTSWNPYNDQDANYAGWNPPTAWLEAMKLIYDAWLR